MKKFRFKLQTVLELRKNREEGALRVLGEAQQEFQRAIDRKTKLLADLDASLLRREGLGASRVTDIRAFRLEQDFINGQKQRIVQADQGILRAKRGVEKALRAYLYARRQTRMLEVLYDKDHQEFKKQQRRQEQKQLDELSVMRARFVEREVNS